MSEEIWKSIPGYEGAYEVSNLGRVKSLPRYVPRRSKFGEVFQMHLCEKILPKGLPSSHGYYTVRLTTLSGERKLQFIHAMVLLAFVGPRPKGLVCMHLSGDQTDNRWENLEYGTYSKNLLDVLWQGNRLLSVAQVEEIHRLAERGFVYGEQTLWAEDFGVSLQYFNMIVHGRLYGHVV